jgi:hypothetical protein
MGEELALPTAYDAASYAPSREKEQVDPRHADVSVRLESHGCPMEPGRRPVRDDCVLRHHESEALDSQLQAVAQLRGVQDPVNR